MLLNFGQPADGVIQIAYVVADLHSQTRAYAEDLQVGPWLTLPRFAGFQARYRGEACQAEVAMATAFSGHHEHKFAYIDNLVVVSVEKTVGEST
jgi:hypothetical protein